MRLSPKATDLLPAMPVSSCQEEEEAEVSQEEEEKEEEELSVPQAEAEVLNGPG